MKSRVIIFINWVLKLLFNKKLVINDDIDIFFDTLFSLRNNSQLKDNDSYQFAKFVAKNYSRSRSQIFQDLWVLHELSLREISVHKKYFIEFGAYNGIDLSNTYLLEQDLDWEGLLCEPIPSLHKEILKSRRAKLEKRVVAGKSGETVNFLISENEEYSSIESFSNNDKIDKRSNSKVIKVCTVSMDDLIKEFGKEYITFLSIDTEGSEFEILQNFSWEVPVLMVCVEHNFGKNKDKIFDILTRQGYVQRYSNLSKFDSWWILSEENTKKYLSKI